MSEDGTPADSCPLTTAPDEQRAPAVAFDGTNFLVVWQDARNITSIDIYGARVSPSGVVLDPSGFLIDGGGTDLRARPSVAWNGSQYLVAWRQDIPAPGPDIFAVRVTPAAVVTGTPANLSRTVASGAFAMGTSTATASDGSAFLVVWGNHGSGSDLAGRIVGPLGEGLTGTVICGGANAQGHPAVAFSGTEYMVTWDDDRRSAGDLDILATTVSTTGTVGACTPISQLTGNERVPRIASDGGLYYIAWEDPRSGAGDIYGARVQTSLTVLDPAGIRIASDAAMDSTPAVAPSTVGAVVLWVQASAGHARRFSETGIPGGTVVDLPVAGMISEPAIAFGAARYLVVAAVSGSAGADIYGWFMDSTGTTITGPFLISGGGCR